MTSARALVVGAVAAHLALAVAHAVSHVTIPVLVADRQYAFVLIAVFLAPLAGAVLLATGRIATGAWVVLASGLASFGFEGLFHFVVPNPDHVASVEPGAAAFAETATLATASDALLVVAAGWVLWRRVGFPAERSTVPSLR